MSENKHTPGPWVVEIDGYYPVIRKNFRVDHHMTICGPVHGYMYSDDEKANQAANARLIAAAPELLQSLKAMIKIINGNVLCMDECEDYDEAIMAIEKATGELA